MWNTFHGLLNNIFSLYCPICQPKPHRSFSLAKNVLTLIQCKHRAWRNLKSNNNTITMFAFTNVSDMSRRAVKAFYCELELTVLHSNNIRSFYAYVNSHIRPRPVSPQLINPSTPNSLTSDPNMVRNIFNKYFGSVYTIDDNLLLLHIDTLLQGLMPVDSFDHTKIISTIYFIKSSTGPDKIHLKI